MLMDWFLSKQPGRRWNRRRTRVWQRRPDQHPVLLFPASNHPARRATCRIQEPSKGAK